MQPEGVFHLSKLSSAVSALFGLLGNEETKSFY